MADLEKQIDKALAKRGMPVASHSKAGSHGGAREVFLIGVGLVGILGLGLWQVWSGDKRTPPNKGA